MKIWDKFGFDCRLYDIPGMGHNAAAPKDFREALVWIDTP